MHEIVPVEIVYHPRLHVAPWITNNCLPWLDADMWDPGEKIFGISPEDIRYALKRHSDVVKPEEIIGNEPVEIRTAFLCARITTTHPEPVRVDICP